MLSRVLADTALQGHRRPSRGDHPHTIAAHDHLPRRPPKIDESGAVRCALWLRAPRGDLETGSPRVIIPYKMLMIFLFGLRIRRQPIGIFFFRRPWPQERFVRLVKCAPKKKSPSGRRLPSTTLPYTHLTAYTIFRGARFPRLSSLRPCHTLCYFLFHLVPGTGISNGAGSTRCGAGQQDPGCPM